MLNMLKNFSSKILFQIPFLKNCVWIMLFCTNVPVGRLSAQRINMVNLRSNCTRSEYLAVLNYAHIQGKFAMFCYNLVMGIFVEFVAYVHQIVTYNVKKV